MRPACPFHEFGSSDPVSPDLLPVRGSDRRYRHTPGACHFRGCGSRCPGGHRGPDCQDLGRRDGITLDQLGRGIDIDVVLATIVSLAVLLGTASVRGVFRVLVGWLGVIQPGGNSTGFEGSVFLAAIALARGFDNGGIDHRSGLGDIIPLGESPSAISFEARS